MFTISLQYLTQCNMILHDVFWRKFSKDPRFVHLRHVQKCVLFFCFFCKHPGWKHSSRRKSRQCPPALSHYHCTYVRMWNQTFQPVPSCYALTSKDTLSEWELHAPIQSKTLKLVHTETCACSEEIFYKGVKYKMQLQALKRWVV